MPSVHFSDWAQMRVEALSFFVAAVLVSTAVVRWLWNYLAAEFPRMPRLTYKKALAVVLLWGLVATLVLMMIAGARELLTPGAGTRRAVV